jgi:translation initiation factor IF-3
MVRRRSMAQVVCGIVAGAGIALGGTAGLMLTDDVYNGGTHATPARNVAKTGGAGSPSSPAEITADAAAAERGTASQPAKATKKKSAAPKHASHARNRSRPQRRAKTTKRRVAPESAVAQVRPRVHARAPARPAPVVTRQPAPVVAPHPAPSPKAPAPVSKAPNPARKAPAPAPSAEPASNRTFDDSG